MYLLKKELNSDLKLKLIKNRNEAGTFSFEFIYSTLNQEKIEQSKKHVFKDSYFRLKYKTNRQNYFLNRKLKEEIDPHFQSIILKSKYFLLRKIKNYFLKQFIELFKKRNYFFLKYNILLNEI